MSSPNLATLAAPALLLMLQACHCDGGATLEHDTFMDQEGIRDATGDPDTQAPEQAPEGVHGTIRGNISIELYETTEEGDVVALAWEDSCFGAIYPYGSIYVAALVSDEATGQETYFADTLISTPNVDPDYNPYVLEVETDQTEEVHVYAVLDKWGDGVISASDPSGIYAEPISLADGETVEDIDISILTEYWCGSSYGDCPDCPTSWGSGSCLEWTGSEWISVCDGECDTIEVSGHVNVSTPYNSGSAMAMMVIPSTGEPYYIDSPITLTGRDCDASACDGADGQHSFVICTQESSWELLGAWDSNGNGIYDPGDTWGEAVDENDSPIGSITVSEADLPEQRILIPAGESSLDIVPYVLLSGEVSMAAGDFDDLLANYPEATVYVTLLKYFPSGDLSLSAFDEAYDYEAWTAEEFQNQSGLSFSLMAPANTTAYLWATADVDNDETLNESEDPVGCPNGGSCMIATGTSSQSGLDIQLASFSDTGQ